MKGTGTRDHLAEALRALCIREGGERSVAAVAGVNPTYLWQIIHGAPLPSGRPRGVGPKLADKLDKFFPGWTDPQHSLAGAKPRGAVAHVLSDPSQSNSALIFWGEVVKQSLPERFRVAAPDDSMSPRVRAGQICEFSTTEKPRPGDGILVRDSTGATYFRRYRERRPGSWEAFPENDAYQPLDSQVDDLQVLAVLVAVHARWG